MDIGYGRIMSAEQETHTSISEKTRDRRKALDSLKSELSRIDELTRFEVGCQVKKDLERPRPWTAARCMRLLRPLTLRARTVRLVNASARATRQIPTKPPEAPLQSQPSAEDQPQVPKKRPGKRKALFSIELLTDDEQTTDNSDSDPYPDSSDDHRDDEEDLLEDEWIWSIPRKRARHRYKSARNTKTRSFGKSNERQPTVEELDRLQTIADEAQNQAWFDHASLQRLAIAMDCDNQVRNTLAGLPCYSSDRKREIQTRARERARWFGIEKSNTTEQLFQAFDGVLHITCSQSENENSCQQRGAKSLLSMCVRRIPWCIAQETQNRQAEEPDDKTDVTDEIYTYLEENYSSSLNSGWKELRHVVRASSVFMLQQLIQDGELSSPQMLKELLSICYNHYALDEAAQLICSFATVTESAVMDPPPGRSIRSSLEDMPILEMLKRHTVKASSHLLAYRTVKQLIATGKLPVQWLMQTSSKWLSWFMLASLAAADDDDDKHVATDLVSTALYVAAGRSDVSVREEFRPGVPKTASVNDSSMVWTFMDKILQMIVQGAVIHRENGKPFVHTLNIMRTWCASFLRANLRGDRTSDETLTVPGCTKLLLFAAVTLYSLKFEDDGGLALPAILHYIEVLKQPSLGIEQKPRSWALDLASLVVSFNRIMDRSVVDFYLNMPLWKLGVSSVSVEIDPNVTLEVFEEVIRAALALVMREMNRLSLDAIRFLQAVFLESVAAARSVRKDADHERLVSSIQSSIEASDASLSTNDPNDPAEHKETIDCLSDFRWESGLSEWVARTPKTKETGVYVNDRVPAQPRQHNSMGLDGAVSDNCAAEASHIQQRGVTRGSRGRRSSRHSLRSLPRKADKSGHQTHIQHPESDQLDELSTTTPPPRRPLRPLKQEQTSPLRLGARVEKRQLSVIGQSFGAAEVKSSKTDYADMDMPFSDMTMADELA